MYILGENKIWVWWVLSKANYHGKVAMNLNPEVDVRGGGGRGECNTHQIVATIEIFYKNTHTPSLYIFWVTKDRISQKLILIFISDNVYSIHKKYRKFGIFWIWTFYGMLWVNKQRLYLHSASFEKMWKKFDSQGKKMIKKCIKHVIIG